MKKEISYQIGNSIIVFNNEFPKSQEEKKENLRKFYIGVNKLARELESKGINTKSWFYTDNQIEKMKKNKKYNFI